jgi:Ca2+-binding RTX toxin-like protein
MRKFEKLEDRRLMAADIDLDNGVLSIQGTDNSDSISVNSFSDPDTLVATVVDDLTGTILAREEYDRDDVREIVAHGLNGGDWMQNFTGIRAKFFGGNGNDNLSGGGGNDLLDGGANDDTITGGRGNNDLIGGIGNDYYYFGSLGSSDVVHEDASVNTDTLNFSGMNGPLNINLASTTTQVVGSGVTLRLTSATGIENLHGTVYSDMIRGNSRNNTMWGLVGNDSLFGEGGDDELHGDSGKDSLYGSIGNDKLLGEVGNDWLYGEAGLDTLDGGADNDFLDGGRDGYQDVLTGGSGADTFVKYKKRTIPFFDYEQKVTDYNSAVDAVLTVWY